MPHAKKIDEKEVQEFLEQQEMARLWPEDVQYDWSCIAHEETESKSTGHPMIKLSLMCYGNGGREKEMILYMTFPPEPGDLSTDSDKRKYKWALINIKNTCKAAGLEEYYNNHDDIPSDVFLNTSGKLTMGIEKWTYKGKSGTKNTIDKLINPEDQKKTEEEFKDDDVPF